MSKKKIIILMILISLLSSLLASILVLKIFEIYAEKHAKTYISTKLTTIYQKEVYIDDIDISLIFRKIILKNISVSGISFAGNDVSINMKRLALKVNLKNLSANLFPFDEMVFEKPELFLKSAELSIKAKEPGFSFIEILPQILFNVNFNKITIKSGSIHHEFKDSSLNLLDNINVAVSAQSGGETVDGQVPRQVLIKFKSIVPSEKNAALNGSFLVKKSSAPLDFEGDVRFEGISVPYYYKHFNESDTDIANGVVDVVSTIRCSNNWLTASNIVSIDKLSIATGEKKIYGIETGLVTSFFEENKVSFSLPISGDIKNLNYDFGTAMTQVLAKALRKKFKSESFIKKTSEKYGRSIGKKIETSLLKMFEK